MTLLLSASLLLVVFLAAIVGKTNAIVQNGYSCTFTNINQCTQTADSYCDNITYAPETKCVGGNRKGETCTDKYDCYKALACNADGICYNETGGEKGDFCTEDSHCKDDFRCDTNLDECKANNKAGDGCLSVFSVDTCGDDAYICGSGNKLNRCVWNKKVGEACETDYWCAGDDSKCTDGLCTAFPVALVAGLGGGVVFLIVVGLIVYCCCIRKSKKNPEGGKYGQVKPLMAKVYNKNGELVEVEVLKVERVRMNQEQLQQLEPMNPVSPPQPTPQTQGQS